MTKCYLSNKGEYKLEIKDNHVTAALDISRVFKGIRDPIISAELDKIIFLGREVDLLETLRRQDNPEENFFIISKKEIELLASVIGIQPMLLDLVIFKDLQSQEYIDILDEEKIEIKIKESKEVYSFAKELIKKNFNEREICLLDLIAKGMIKPVPQKTFDDAISNFPKHSQKKIEDYLVQTQILSPLQIKENIVYLSPKIYKDKNSFCRLLEENDDEKITEILEYISENPGIPIESIDKNTYNPKLIRGLTIVGALDPIDLNIDGSPKQYIVPSNICTERYDNDHLDLVKKTLANFRFGERYSKWKLRDLQTFLEYLLERGYAGKATPIGTDYRNLELAGIVKVTKVIGSKHRFWMLKKDVIEDTLNVLNGAVPLILHDPNICLHEMNNSVMSRMIAANTSSKEIAEISEALRKIQEIL
jgi:hypothetical protein